MATAAPRAFSPIPADPEKLDRLVGEFADACAIQPAQVVVRVSYQFEDGATDIRRIEPSAICALVPFASPISMLTLRGENFQSQVLQIHVGEDHVVIAAEADTVSMAKDLVERAVGCLGLAPYDPPTQRQVAALAKRLDAVQALQQEDVHLRCFLSFRFTAVDEALAAQVESKSLYPAKSLSAPHELQ